MIDLALAFLVILLAITSVAIWLAVSAALFILLAFSALAIYLAPKVWPEN